MTQNEQYILIIALLLLFIQGVWIFFDASKRGHNKWLWGLLGLTNCPSALIIYLLVTRAIDKKIICPNCLYAVPLKSQYCSYCGHHISEEERKLGSNNFIEKENTNR